MALRVGVRVGVGVGVMPRMVTQPAVPSQSPLLTLRLPHHNPFMLLCLSVFVHAEWGGRIALSGLW